MPHGVRMSAAYLVWKAFTALSVFSSNEPVIGRGIPRFVFKNSWSRMTWRIEPLKFCPRNSVMCGVHGRAGVIVAVLPEEIVDVPVIATGDTIPLRPPPLPLRLALEAEEPPLEVFEVVVFVFVEPLVSDVAPPFEVPLEMAGGLFDEPALAPLPEVSVTTGVPVVLPPFDEETETDGAPPVEPPFVEPDEIAGAEALESLFEPPFVDVVVIAGALDVVPPLSEPEATAGVPLFDALVDPPFEESLATLGAAVTVIPVSSARAMLRGEKAKEKMNERMKKRETSEKGEKAAVVMWLD